MAVCASWRLARGGLGRPAVLAGATHNERLERWMSRERTMSAGFVVSSRMKHWRARGRAGSSQLVCEGGMRRC